MKVRALLLLALLFPGAAAFGQTDAAAAPAAEQVSIELQILSNIKDLYAKAEYEPCRKAIGYALEQEASGKLHFRSLYLAEIHLYQALVVYAFREAGFEKEIDALLRKAVELDINYEFTDYRVIPTFVLEKYRDIKAKYLARFSKSTRRHSLGLFGTVSYFSTVLQSPQFLNLGVHYSFNVSELFSFLLDAEFPLSDQFINQMQFRVGAILFPSFKIETISLGLGLFYSLKFHSFAAFTHAAAIEGYGEILWRFGLGLGACVEILRLDVYLGPDSLQMAASSMVDLFSTDQVRFSFANLRVYVFWTF